MPSSLAEGGEMASEMASDEQCFLLRRLLYLQQWRRSDLERAGNRGSEEEEAALLILEDCQGRNPENLSGSASWPSHDARRPTQRRLVVFLRSWCLYI